MAFNDGFICYANAMSPGAGSDLTSSGPLALGQQNPVTMSLRKFLSVLSLQFLVMLCIIVILVLDKTGKHIVPRGKGCLFFFFFLVCNLQSENISRL